MRSAEKSFTYILSVQQNLLSSSRVLRCVLCVHHDLFFFYLLASGRTEIFPWTCVHKAFYGSTKSKTGFVLKPFVKMLSNLYREMQFLGMISILKDSPIYFLKSINLPTRWLPPKKRIRHYWGLHKEFFLKISNWVYFSKVCYMCYDTIYRIKILGKFNRAIRNTKTEPLLSFPTFTMH